MNEHYLDNSATTRVSEAAANAALHAMRTAYGNPSSVHGMGIDAEDLLERARRQVAAALGAEKDEVFFTSCGTEADNWALRCGMEAGRRVGKHLITTAVEHAAILRTGEFLRDRGFEVTFLPPTAEGGLDLDALRAALRPDTALVSVMMVNNEVGAVTDVAAVSALLKAAGSKALLHTDAVQGFLKVPFSAARLGADLISVSGHKIHAPKGVGALYVRKGLRLPPLLLGGGQEKGRRSGTESVPLIAAFGAAAEAGARTLKRDVAHMTALRDAAREGLLAIPGVVLNGSGQAPHIVSVSLPGCPSEVVLRILEGRGVYVSAGSACSRGHRSHVLEAMGLDAARIDSALRISFCPENTMEDVTALLEGVREAKARLERKK